MLKNNKNVLAIILFFLGTLFFVGCQEEQTIVTPENISTNLSKYSLPVGATFISASLNIYVNHPNGQVINLHRITSPWLETTVTWQNFGGAFDPVAQPFNFIANTVGYKSVDVTSLVQSWINGTNPDYGILLDQAVLNSAYANYHSSENTNAPYLRIYYSTSSGTSYVDVIAVEDAYIWELNPTTNYNTIYLYTGWLQNFEKQTLVRFDIEPTPQMECETAYAYGDGIATCFLDLSPISANNWGWTNYIGPGTYNWPIYAGAGQCDISKGTLVGNLNVVYSGGTLTITYELDPGFVLGETHVWVGSTPLPLKRGVYITAPGQFNYNGVNPVVVSGLTGNIYIAAHSGVCWEVN